MKRILGLALSLALFSIPMLAAKNSQVFYVPSDVRIGSTQLREGRIDVTWTASSGSQVQLTIKTPDGKTITVPAQMTEEKHNAASVMTSGAKGAMHLEGFRTKTASFIIQDAPKSTK